MDVVQILHSLISKVHPILMLKFATLVLIILDLGMSTVVLWLSSRNFFQGAKSIVMQIYFVTLLFSDQISGRGKVSEGGKLPHGPPVSPLPPPVEESQYSKHLVATRRFLGMTKMPVLPTRKLPEVSSKGQASWCFMALAGIWKVFQVVFWCEYVYWGVFSADTWCKSLVFHETIFE